MKRSDVTRWKWSYITLPPPILHSVKRSDVTRWKQGYIWSPPLKFIVLVSSVKTKEVKVIEFHRILSWSWGYCARGLYEQHHNCFSTLYIFSDYLYIRATFLWIRRCLALNQCTNNVLFSGWWLDTPSSEDMDPPHALCTLQMQVAYGQFLFTLWIMNLFACNLSTACITDIC